MRERSPLDGSLLEPEEFHANSRWSDGFFDAVRVEPRE